MKFSATLKDFKSENKLTQLQMAEALGLSLRMYQYYERGDFDGAPDKVKKYTEQLARMKAQGFKPDEDIESEQAKYIRALEGKIKLQEKLIAIYEEQLKQR